MPKSVFPYPGGKFYHVDWVISHFPQHECYVEPFGGAATVLVNKPQGKNEVFNDIDDNIVQFFDVLREREDELTEWLVNVKYSRTLHERFRDNFYERDYPNDPIKRAGQFFFLRLAQSGGTYHKRVGFLSGPNHKTARRFARMKEQLSEFSDRFDTVTLENRDYRKILDQYDSKDTLFYLDPPYVGTEGYYGGEFDHDTFASTVDDIEGSVIVSYSDVPESFNTDKYHVKTKSGDSKMSFREVKAKTKNETLLMNFDPEQTASFTEANQSTIEAYE